MLRKSLSVALTSAVLLATAAPAPSVAQTVYCTNCASQLTQLKQQADQALQLLRQAEQLKVQLDSYNQMMRDAVQLPQHLFSDVARDFNQLNQILDSAKGIAYTAQNIDQEFMARYGNLESYRASGMGNAEFSAKYRQWNTETSDSARQTFRVLGAQADALRNEQQLLGQLQNQARSARGHQETLSVANEMSAETIGQLMKLRQLLMTQMQMQAQTMQLEADQDAVNAARHRTFIGQTTATPTYTGQTF